MTNSLFFFKCLHDVYQVVQKYAACGKNKALVYGSGFFSSSRLASSTLAAGVEEGAGVDEVRQPVAARRGRY